ncbi:Y-family DNA polymerase [Dokdonella sp.]|uniref:Y-family DNA polymerase n=1 Tax=Dokdonella sp. TaxID=2291710 RepID=UPI0031C841C3|nr:DNA polymerase Y family protein [Dokdonella sp.]
MSWACIRLPQLALDAALRRHAEPQAPLALVTGPAQARALFAVNPAAQAAGLRPGMRLAMAEALLAGFGKIEYDPAAARRWQCFLAAWAYRYSAEVVLLPDAIGFEASRSLGLFGPWPRFEARLREDLVALGFQHRIALAPVVHAAHALAGAHDGLAVTALDALQRALAPLALKHANLPPATVETLAAMGVRSLGQLLRLPRAGLQRRLGASLLLHLDRLRGLAPDALERYRPPDRLDLQLAWEYDIERGEGLVFPLRRLTADLAACLAGRDGGVQRFTLLLEHADRAPTRIDVGLLAPAREAALLFDCARGRLERQTLPAPVRALRLVANDLPPFVPAGRDLFDSRPAHAIPPEELRERLRARLGGQALQRLACTVDPRPERAQSSSAPPATLPSARLPRPTWLLETPIPLRGPPPTLLAGPERLETGWWDGGDLRRDYYLARTSEGQRAWIFCAPGERGPWMLHGWFA